MIEISRILLKLKQKAYSSKDSVCCVELDFESHQISGIYRVAEYQMKKLAVCLLTGAERSGVCLPWRGSLTTRQLKPANTRHHQSASRRFSTSLVYKEKLEGKHEKQMQENHLFKKSHLVWLNSTWEFPDQFSLYPKENPSLEKYCFFKYMHHWLLLILNLDSF